MVVLDSNVLSVLMESNCEPRVLRCLDQFAPESLWTTSVNVFEIRAGLLTMPKGKRQKALLNEFETILSQSLEGRVLEFDASAAERAAHIAARRRFSGRPVDMRDLFIAGIVESRHGILATRNVRHFEADQVKVINPWNDE